jgi:hypothetical protein
MIDMCACIQDGKNNHIDMYINSLHTVTNHLKLCNHIDMIYNYSLHANHSELYNYIDMMYTYSLHTNHSKLY